MPGTEGAADSSGRVGAGGHSIVGDIVRDVMGDPGDVGAARNSARVVRRSASRSGTAKSPATTPGQGAQSAPPVSDLHLNHSWALQSEGLSMTCM